MLFLQTVLVEVQYWWCATALDTMTCDCCLKIDHIFHRFELFESVRKLLLTAVFVNYASHDANEYLILAFILTFFSMLITIWMKPYAGRP